MSKFVPLQRLALMAVALLLLASGTGQARVRDDVMSSAFRCAAIADDHLWLDCYYGAAQPARNELGLSSAPASQIRLVASPPVGGSIQNETVRDAIMAQAARCMTIPGDRQWLDCYYAATMLMREQLALPVLPQNAKTLSSAAPSNTTSPQTTTRVSVASGPPPMPRNHSIFAGIFGNVPPIVKNMPMKSYSLDRNGAFTMVLADGEVWAQLEEDAVYHPAHWQSSGARVIVTISPSAMHTFTMIVNGENRIYKVHRIS